MKKLLPLSIVLGALIVLIGSFSSTTAKFIQIKVSTGAYCATNTAICGTASEPLTLLMDFVGEMINSIKTQGTQGDYLGQYVSPNRFVGNAFSPPVKTVVGKLARNLTQKLKFGLASTAIFANPVNFAGLKDVAGGTVLLAKNKVFLRDVKIIEKLESQLADKKYELGAGGGRYEKIIPENLAIMQGIVNKYKDQGLFDADRMNQIVDGALYNNVTSMLTQMLSAAKSFLYFDTTEQFDIITRGNSDTVIISFDTGAMQHLVYDYSCARGISNPCDSSIKKFKDNIKMLQASAKASMAGTKEIFQDAAKRFAEAFQKEQLQDLTGSETDLLRSMYGNQNLKEGILFGNPGEFNFNETNGSSETAGAVVDSLTAPVKAVANYIRSWKTKAKDPQAQKIEIDNSKIKYNPSQDAFALIMNEYISDVFASQGMDIELATFSEVKDITPAFTIIGKQIEAIEKNILGSKEDKVSLISALGSACELQCGRFGLCR